MVDQPQAKDGNWHYFALTYDGKVMRYYFDGELSHEMKVVDTIKSANTDLIIGDSNGQNTYSGVSINFDEKISAVCISNRARSSDEIQQSARVGKNLLLKK